jgi:hypothetical protein
MPVWRGAIVLVIASLKCNTGTSADGTMEEVTVVLRFVLTIVVYTVVETEEMD